MLEAIHSDIPGFFNSLEEKNTEAPNQSYKNTEKN